MKTVKNSRKIHVLALLNNINTLYTAEEIANMCPVSTSSVRASLKGYCNQAIIKREKRDGIYVYWITQKGVERLEYLLGENNSIKNQIELLVREKIRI
jgi:predicted transcriptional regulator